MPTIVGGSIPLKPAEAGYLLSCRHCTSSAFISHLFLCWRSGARTASRPAAIHTQNILPRDIKLDSVLIDGDACARTAPCLRRLSRG